MDCRVTALLLLASLVFTCSATAQTYGLNQQTPPFGNGTATARQDGWRFRVNIAGVTVTHLTCFYPPAATTAHTVTLFNYPAGTVVAQLVIPPGTGWRNTQLTTSVSLTQNSEYIISGVPRYEGEVAVFEDQYACTGGQIYNLAIGQDRFVADLRPLVQPLVAARGTAIGHCCHPYDLCTKLIAEEAGVVVTDPSGKQVCAPLDTESNVAWTGYANRALHNQIAPVLVELLRKHAALAK
jgi:hypothetical protein